MNDILQKIMTFINENTYLLIGICVFLILVLVGYLIDNSVKSKRVRKDIKNKDQVPEEIKNEIIKEAINENKEKIMENSFHNAVRENSEDELNKVNLENKNEKVDLEKTSNIELNLNEVQKQEKLDTSFNLDNTDISEPFSLDWSEPLKDETNNSDINEPLVLDSDNMFVEDVINEEEPKVNISQDIMDKPLILESNLDNESSFDLNINDSNVSDNLIVDTPVSVDLNSNIDPDINIMNQNVENAKYKNDKKLSEILSNIDKERVNNNGKGDSLIFDNTISSIEVNTNVDKNQAEIEVDNNSSDELDRIMKKLSSMNNDEEDNYTNIF